MSSNDTIILSFLRSDDCPLLDNEEITSFTSWCDSHHFILNTNKMKEMLFDPWGLRNQDPVFIDNCAQCAQVCFYKYLGVVVDDTLNWCQQVQSLCIKLAQRIHTFSKEVETVLHQCIFFVLFCFLSSLENFIKWWWMNDEFPLTVDEPFLLLKFVIII